jgi:hypothetical protein
MKILHLLLLIIFDGLTTCRICKEKVSYHAKGCPHCGGDNPGKRWWIPLLKPLFIFFFFSAYLLYNRYWDEILIFIEFIKKLFHE